MKENVIFRVTLLVSGEIVFDGDHGTWRTIAYTQCILCDTVGFRRSFWIAVVGSPVLSSLPSPLHTHLILFFFVCARNFSFVLRKDGILYFIILRSDGFR